MDAREADEGWDNGVDATGGEEFRCSRLCQGDLCRVCVQGGVAKGVLECDLRFGAVRGIRSVRGDVERGWEIRGENVVSCRDKDADVEG